MFPNHFRRIALAQGLLANDSLQQRPADAPPPGGHTPATPPATDAVTAPREVCPPSD
jgi:hypothetical protein